METKKNFFNYIKNSYSNTTNFADFKIFKVFYCLALLLTLLFIPTVNVQAEDIGTKFEKIDIPFNLIKDKYYFMFSLGSTDSPYYYVLTADSPIYMKLGDSDYYDPVYDDDMNSEWYYPTISPDTFDSKVSCYRLAPYDDDWTIAFKEFYFRDGEWNLYDSIYNQKNYLTNHDVTFVNGNYYSQGFNAPKNDNEVSYPYQPSLPGEEKPEDTLYYDTTLPPEVLKDFYNDYADYMKYYPNFIVRKMKYSSYEFYIATFFNPKNLYIKPGDGIDRREEDKLYWSSIENDWSNDFIHLTYMPEDDNYDFYYIPDAYDFPYEELSSTKEYFTDFDFIYNGEVVLKKNNIPIEPPVEEPPVEEPPVEETPIVGNESYIIINGEKVSVNYAIVQYLMRIEFIITLLFTVTVVFFIINKFWAWCRRLFTTSIH